MTGDRAPENRDAAERAGSSPAAGDGLASDFISSLDQLATESLGIVYFWNVPCNVFSL